jgi:hypothetical protein
MSFDIAVTPTLQAVATHDEDLLAQTLQARVQESIASVDTGREVVEALDAQRAAEERLDRLRKAERSLSRFAKESRQQTASAMQSATDALIESAAAGDRMDLKKLSTITSLENQSRHAHRAIERIVEHLIPTAEIVSLRAGAFAMMTRARGIETAAQDRAEKVLGQLRDAVTEEMVLPVDMSKGVAGALLAHAAGLRRCAVQLDANADQLERTYSDRLKLAGSR